MLRNIGMAKHMIWKHAYTPHGRMAMAFQDNFHEFGG